MRPEPLLAGVLLGALGVYTLSGGADFGGGFWDLLARGPRAKAQRRLIADAIGPIWEANHVWLILVVVILFSCFPVAFAAITTALHIPLLLLLFGVVLRGAAFVFRAYDPTHPDRTDGPWERVFALSSALTPVMLGVCLGAVASGALRLDASGRVITDFVSAWWAPFPFAVGGLVLALWSLLAASYLAVEAREPALVEDFRRRALGAAVATGALAGLALLLARSGAPGLFAGLASAGWSLPFQVATGLVALGAIGALARRRLRLARLLVMGQALLIVAGYGAATWPYLLPPDLSIEAAAASDAVLWPVLGILAAGALPLGGAFAWLFWVFKGRGGGGAP